MKGRGTFTGVMIVGVLVLWLIPELYKAIFESNAVRDGMEMIYAVEESLGKGQERRYGVTLRFRERPQGGFRLVINSPHGARTLNLFEDTLLPTADPDNDHLEIATVSGMKVRPEMVWRPPERRRPGKNCRTGVVVGLVSWGGQRVWQVMHPDGVVFFTEETGLLAGLELEHGRTKLTARLRRVR